LNRARGVTAETHELSKNLSPIRPSHFAPESPQEVRRGEIALLNRKLRTRSTIAYCGAIPDDVHVPVD
jgi:hypothetical protein